jgi:nondiscriminating glutamyl-tRNA synthetase
MFRFAISSKEDIDISNLRIALLNYIKSQQNSDSFIVRVNDIAKDSAEGEEQESIDILKKFAINCENLIYQSKNLSIYQQMAKKLVDEKKAYACFCIEEGDDFKKAQCQCKNLSDKQVKERVSNREKFTICIDAPVEPITLRDTIEGVVTVAKEDVGKFTLLKEDANPTHLLLFAKLLLRFL